VLQRAKRFRTKWLIRERRAGNEEIAWLESSQNLGGGLPIDAANPDNGVIVQKNLVLPVSRSPESIAGIDLCVPMDA
jgi:hypothetical protein